MGKELAITPIIRCHYIHILLFDNYLMSISFGHNWFTYTYVAFNLISHVKGTTNYLDKEELQMDDVEIASDNFQHQGNSVQVLLRIFHFLYKLFPW